MGKLEGKVAVITGGATGIGRAAAKRFIDEGAFVFIFSRRQEALEAAVADLGPNARAVKGSVSDPADLDRLYAAVKAERGSLDIVFANAGAGSQLRLGEITATPKGTIFTVQKAPRNRPAPGRRRHRPVTTGRSRAYANSTKASATPRRHVTGDYFRLVPIATELVRQRTMSRRAESGHPLDPVEPFIGSSD
jgi:NAD(P)-dependent dehydrogenase (short-subunit alcohol dehydrogenase family)